MVLSNLVDITHIRSGLVNPNASKSGVYQLKDLMILCIVALVGEKVSSLYGIKEP
jgi:hypothetical protein